MRDGFFYSYRAADVNPLVLECRSRSICHGKKKRQKTKQKNLPRNDTESKITHVFQSRMRERRLLPCAGVYNFLLHIFTSLKRKRRILKEAKYFYREDAKTAKRQKGRSKKHFSHGISRKDTELHGRKKEEESRSRRLTRKEEHIFQSRKCKRRNYST